MQSKVVTSDQKTRLEFKSKIADKIKQALTPEHVDPEPEVVPMTVVVPANFHSLSKVTLYGVLTHDRGLSPEDANEVIEILGGKPSKEFTLILEGFAKEEEPELESQIEIKQLAVELPYNFNSLRVDQKFLWLSKESNLGLSFEEVNDIIDLLNGKPTLSNTEFHITFSDPPLPDPVPPLPNPNPDPEPIDPFPEPDEPEPIRLPENHNEMTEQELFNALTHNTEFACSSDMAVKTLEYYFGRSDDVIEMVTLAGSVVEPRKIEAIVKNPEVKTYKRVTVGVPSTFGSLKAGDQYMFLTRTLKLAPEFANDVMAVFKGETPLCSHEYVVKESMNHEFSEPVIEEVVPEEE